MGCGINEQTEVSLQIRVLAWYPDEGAYCPSGRMNPIQCTEACTIGTWGTNCDNTCECNSSSTERCAADIGECECKSGYEDVSCDKECSSGSYGVRCTMSCTHCSQHSVYDIHGTCNCAEGYYGEFCEKTCPSNHYCVSICNCDSQSICNPINGECILKYEHITSILLLSPHFQTELFSEAKIILMEKVIGLLQQHSVSPTDMTNHIITQTNINWIIFELHTVRVQVCST